MDPDQVPQNNSSNLDTGNSSSNDEYYKIVKPVRTYERDLAEYVRDTQASKAEVNIKEQKRKREKVAKEIKVKTPAKNHTESLEPRKNSSLWIVISLLAVAIAGAGFYFIQGAGTEEKPREETAPETKNFQTIVEGDVKKLVEIEERDRQSTAEALEKASREQSTNTGEVIIFHLADKTDNQSISIDPQTFLRRIESRAPSFLLRSLGERMDFGLISFERFSSFLVMEVEDFNNAFAGMLQWEKNMSIDLFGWVSEEIASGKSFKDLSLNGKDLRVLTNADGQVILLYTFLDQKTILITDKISTYKEILKIF